MKLYTTACIIMALVVTSTCSAAAGVTYSTGPGVQLPVLGVSTFGSSSFGVITLPSYTISTAVVGGNGTINCISPVIQGESTTCSINPAIGASVSGCGGSLSGTTYTTGAITSACTVTAMFSQIPLTTYTVTPSAGTGGSISPSTPQIVNSGTTTSFTVTPASGYNIASVSGCGGSLNGMDYTTGAITGACTVTATFNLNNIYPSGDVSGDGKVDISDALIALRISIGVVTPTAVELARGDVGPLANGKPSPDGKIDIGDAVIILQKSVGLLSW